MSWHAGQGFSFACLRPEPETKLDTLLSISLGYSIDLKVTGFLGYVTCQNNIAAKWKSFKKKKKSVVNHPGMAIYRVSTVMREQQSNVFGDGAQSN